jgi:hypothetical protein
MLRSLETKFEFLCCGISRHGFANVSNLHQITTGPNIWIGDTGASVDMTPCADGAIETKPSNVSIYVGNSANTAATHCGKLHVTICDNTGKDLHDASFHNIHLVPEAPYNTISITQRMENGWTLSGTKNSGIILRQDGRTMRFDIKIGTAKAVYGIYRDRINCNWIIADCNTENCCNNLFQWGIFGCNNFGRVLIWSGVQGVVVHRSFGFIGYDALQITTIHSSGYISRLLDYDWFASRSMCW